MRGRLSLVVLICTVAFGSAPARASSSQCGGRAPLVVTCQTGGTLSGGYAYGPEPGFGFTGRIVATISTASGSRTRDCSYTASITEGCTTTIIGSFYLNQQYTLVGEASGIGFREMSGIGDWTVRVVS